MIFFLLFLLIIMFQQAKIASENEFITDYMSKEKTNAVKGVFVILVLFSHYSQYVNLGGMYDEAYIILKNHLNQMVVSMFLFYSGYGMMESLKKKGFQYVKTIPVKRFLTVLVNFDIAVLLFAAVGFFLGKTYDLQTFLLSLIGWKNVGNSNWYIFAVLVMYILVFIAFYLLKWVSADHIYYIGTMILTLLTVVFVYILMKAGRPQYCYNTIALLPLGCWFSLLKARVEKILMRNDYLYVLASILMFLLYFLSFRVRWKYGIEGYTIWACSFTALVLLVTMKIGFCNPILTWFGNHVFSVYILQRIPMMVLQHFGLAESNKYVFLILTLLMTVFLSLVFDYFTGKIDRALLVKLGTGEDHRVKCE